MRRSPSMTPRRVASSPRPREPHDPTGRFTYWPHRIARGGDVLVPGPAWRQVQFVDVRDLGRPRDELE